MPRVKLRVIPVRRVRVAFLRVMFFHASQHPDSLPKRRSIRGNPDDIYQRFYREYFSEFCQGRFVCLHYLANLTDLRFEDLYHNMLSYKVFQRRRVRLN
jgi:hypothetical protein